MNIDERNVLLVRPPSTQGAMSRYAAHHPINLASLAAALLDNDYCVRIHDMELDGADEELRLVLNRFRPRFLAMTAYTPQIADAAAICRRAKKMLPGLAVVIGGPHATAMPRETMQDYPVFDGLVVGEGEEALPELLSSCLTGSPQPAGSAWRQDDGEISFRPGYNIIKDLDALPVPARRLLSLERYGTTPTADIQARRFTQLFTSRGCPGSCLFCTSGSSGAPLRLRSAASVIEEARLCKVDFGIRHLTIDDDTFTVDSKRLRFICQGFSDLGLSWDCDTRVDAVDEDTLRMMAESGCLKVAFGVESGSPRILAAIDKGISVEKATSAFAAARNAGLLTQAYFMVGSHPMEDEADIGQSIALAKRLKPDILNLSLAVPYPGTGLRRLMEQENLIDEKAGWDAYLFYEGIPPWRTRHLSGRQLARLHRRFVAAYYLDPRYVIGRLIRRRRPLADLRSAFDLIRYLLAGRRG